MSFCLYVYPHITKKTARPTATKFSMLTNEILEYILIH